jgi:hypothetical protein
VKYRRLTLFGNMVRMGETRNTYRILVGKPLVELDLEDREGDWRITLI